MKRKKTILLFTSSLFIFLLTFSGCKKEKIKGCMVSYATNYNSNAEEDDGSCNYSSKIIFWQNQSNASTWTSLGVTSLVFYLDGAIIGSCSPSVYNSSTPTCSGNGQASITKQWSGSTSKNFSYRIEDQTGDVWYSGDIVVNGNECSVHKFD